LQLIHGDQGGADTTYLAEARARALGQSTRLGLTLSQRFGPEVARLATALTGDACASAGHWSTPVQWLPCDGLDAMAEATCSTMADALAADARRSPKAYAVLVRHEHQTVPFETQFLRQGVPYQLPTGLVSYLRRDEVLLLRGLYAYAHDAFDQVPADCLQAMLRSLLRFSGSRVENTGQMGATQEQKDRLAAAKGTQAAAAFVQEHVLGSAAPWASAKLQAALRVLRSESIQTLHQPLLAALDAPGLLARVLVGSQAQRNALQCMRAFLHEARACAGLAEFFADQNALDKLAAQRDWRDGGVTLSTYELAKGREYEHVFLCVPTASGSSAALEQNLLYVALTRAKHSLHLLHDASAPAALLQKMRAAG
jgi:superfamily I DNA/RNA helicase